MRIISLCLIILSLSFCGQAYIKARSNSLIETNRYTSTYLYWFWGSTPTHTVDVSKICPEGHSLIEARYYHSFVGYMALIATWGIVVPIQLEVTCAK
ncbi:hypothetical protein EFP84_04550 [Leptospira kmetyi]|uniref:Bor protein n=1 Tax=Leptospira kmetyi TaxID=408139 RepID=A0AAD0UM02_9LEPT|nr:hypothetical protein EFP84_04550 [Leptospira kmetyi]